jgi:hypothetical protein
MSDKLPTSLRLADDIGDRVRDAAKTAGLSVNQVIDLSLRAGLPRLLSGEYNIFMQETPPSYPATGKPCAPQASAEGPTVPTREPFSNPNKPSKTKRL